MSRPPRIDVVGSVNLDLVMRIGRLPRPGETVTGGRLDHYGGGKGANQALAARRLGAEVALHACVGDDQDAALALALLAVEGVDLSHCRRLAGEATGTALVLVDAGGENLIVVASGANAAFTPDHLELNHADIVIAQLEIPDATLEKAAAAAKFFCLNAAPARAIPPALIARADLIVVNETEAEMLGATLDACAGLVALTLGAQGAVLRHQGREVARARPPKVPVVDTTGAGDAFTAALCVGLGEGMDRQAALDFACRVGALTATRSGAQPSFPVRAALAAL